jgi:hypothetical protein
VEKKMPRVFSGLGQARYALATEILLNFIVKHKTVTRSQVLKFFFRDIDSYTFEVAVQTLIQMGTISAEVTSNPSDMILKLKDKIEPT